MTSGHFRGCLRFSFAELKKPAIHFFFPKSTFIYLSNGIEFAVFSFKMARIRIFFPGGHPRRSGVTLTRTFLTFFSNYLHTVFSQLDVGGVYLKLGLVYPASVIKKLRYMHSVTTSKVACVAGGIVGFSAHKQAAKPRQTSGAAASGLGRRS